MREHDWREIPETCADYERRGCPVCGLTDRRKKQEEWKVTWPCIEPVPEEISFGRLYEELSMHPAVVWQPSTGSRKMSFERHILCHGRPGNWHVGLSKGDGYPYVFDSIRLVCGGLMHWPPAARGVKKLAIGYADLLRAMRARRYNPQTLSNFGYAQRLAKAEYMAALED